MSSINKFSKERDLNKSAFLYKGEVFIYYKSGLTRHVFVNDTKTKVIKMNISDIHDYNKSEMEIYESATEEVKNKMAKTVLTSDNYIEQEFCIPVDESENKMTLSQILFSNSCRKEVGWTNDGRLVCFDLDEYKKY